MTVFRRVSEWVCLWRLLWVSPRPW